MGLRHRPRHFPEIADRVESEDGFSGLIWMSENMHEFHDGILLDFQRHLKFRKKCCRLHGTILRPGDQQLRAASIKMDPKRRHPGFKAVTKSLKGSHSNRTCVRQKRPSLFNKQLRPAPFERDARRVACFPKPPWMKISRGMSRLMPTVIAPIGAAAVRIEDRDARLRLQGLGVRLLGLDAIDN